MTGRIKKPPTSNVRKNTPNHMSHLPGRGDQRWRTAPKIKIAGSTANRGPTGSEPATAETQPVTIASNLVLGLTNTSARFLNSSRFNVYLTGSYTVLRS